MVYFRFGIEFSSNEVKRLWNTLLTDQKRMLEFSQFVRHFGCSSATQGKNYERFLIGLKALSHCNFSRNLQRNSTIKRDKFVTNVWYVKNMLANCDGNLYWPILHLPRVELHCKLHEKLHRVTGP